MHFSLMMWRQQTLFSKDIFTYRYIETKYNDIPKIKAIWSIIFLLLHYFLPKFAN